MEKLAEPEAGFLVRARWGPKRDDPTGKYREALAGASTEAGAEGSELSLRTPQQPVLCTGFGGVALGVVKDLFQWGKMKEYDGMDVGSESGVIIEEVCDDEDGKDDGSEEEVGKEIAEGFPLLTPQDESRKTPGLFLAGPAVQHGKYSFCFIYKSLRALALTVTIQVSRYRKQFHFGC